MNTLLLRAIFGFLTMLAGAWLAWGAGAAIFICGATMLVATVMEELEKEKHRGKDVI